MFDPFGDWETEGYLRNVSKLKDAESIKIQEHLFFTANLSDAADYLAQCDVITYADFCQVHHILFEGFYPWAGQDRRRLGVAQYVNKGDQVSFEDADLSQRAVEHGLELGHDPHRIAENPGEVMGLFAWGHPFLDGNGRTMVIVHTELMARAGLIINWGASRKDAYLKALTKELASPRDRVLDAYLKPLVQPLKKGYVWTEQIEMIAGLNGSHENIDADVVYDRDDPEGVRRYAEAQRNRHYEIPDPKAAHHKNKVSRHRR